MDEIIGALVREAGKQYAEAQKRAAAEAATRRPQGRTAAPTVASVLAPPPIARVRPPSAPTPPARAVPPAPAKPIAMDPDPLVFDTIVAPGLPGVPVRKPDLHLLTAFQSPSGLLAGIVLSEALAPPVALRGSELFDRIER
jgi:hypothetical protein